MSELKFKPGDIVYHKVNGLRMVVKTVISTEYVECVYVTASGTFANHEFSKVELYTHEEIGVRTIISQLEIKK